MAIFHPKGGHLRTIMHKILRYSWLLSLLTSSYAVTIPTDASISDVTNTTNLTTIGALADSYQVPWGPDNFSIKIISATGATINSTNCYMFIIDLLSKLAIEDFNGNMPQTRNVFTNPQYPGIYSGAEARTGGRLLPRRYVFWGIARVMNHLVRHTNFRGGIFQLLFLGREVGKFVLTGGIQTSDTISLETITSDFGSSILNSSTPSLEPPSSPTASQDINTTAIAVGQGTITYTHAFYGSLLSPKDVFMGAIGAMIQLAQDTQTVFTFFLGTFPGYKSIYSTIAPSGTSLNKTMIVEIMVKTVQEAQQRNDFREQKCHVEESGRLIASGGYLENPIPPPSGWVGGDVATS